MAGAVPRLEGLTPRLHFHGRSESPQQPAGHLCPGDVVRVESSSGHRWIYCKVVRIVETGDLLCTLVETQSWSDLALIGAIPGRRYLIALDDVLSVVRDAEADTALAR
jgi:hypothetical protein